MLQDTINPSDIINLHEWQSTQDALAEVLELSLRAFTCEGVPFSRASKESSFCKNIKSKTPDAPDILSVCELKKKLETLKTGKEDLSVKCHFGLSAFIVPIEAVAGRVVLYLVIGPVALQAKKNIEEYTREARRIGINSDDVVDEIVALRVFSHNKIDAISRLLKGIFSHIAQTGYHKRRLGEITPELLRLDPIFLKYYEEKILHSLLESCTLALDADSGSVMTVDRDTNTLHIKAASRLSDDVVASTNIRVGEGIAGMAAATFEPIILPKDRIKNGLSLKMKREYIKSSMIMPFKQGNIDEVYGVINLNITRREAEFSEKDIALVGNIVKMASMALIPLRQTTIPDSCR